MNYIKSIIILNALLLFSICYSNEKSDKPSTFDVAESIMSKAHRKPLISRGNSFIKFGTAISKAKGELYTWGRYDREMLAEFGISLHHFIAGSFTLGLYTYFANIVSGDFNGQKYGLGPSVAFYKRIQDKYTYVFIEAIPSVFTITGPYRSGFSAQFNLGFSQAINRRMSINAALNWNISSTATFDLSGIGLGERPNRRRLEASGTSIGLYLGIGIFFFGS